MFDFLREKKPDIHTCMWIADMSLENLRYINRLHSMLNARLCRIENKLFTEKENIDFYLSEAFCRFDEKE